MKAPLSRRLLRTGALLAVGLCMLLLLTNHLGTRGPGRIQTWHLEYAGGGSCKWRNGPGDFDFQLWLVFLCLTAYPLSLLCGVGALWAGTRDRSVGMGALGGASLAAFVMMWMLGLFSDAFGLC